jgi:serine/threonine protein kinase
MKICPICQAKYQGNAKFCVKDGGVLEMDLSSLVGAKFDGQYDIQQMVGQGAMGAVFRARHALLGDLVAIKVIKPGFGNNTEFTRRFLREGQAARRVKHQNIVGVYDLRTSDSGIIYLVMEFLEGRTLLEELNQRKRFSPAEAIDLLEPIAAALDAAHSMGVVHRDLKPDNIMISNADKEKPVIKLLDLGIAKIKKFSSSAANAQDDSFAITKVGQILGTPYYMSPEQWGSDEEGYSSIDGRTDIYSLGIIFYEMVAGHKPFMAATLEVLACQHGMTIATPLNEIMPEVPKGFSDAIARAMAKKRTDRQASAGELIQQLRAALSAPPALSEAETVLKNAIVDPTRVATAANTTPVRVIIKHLSGSRAKQLDQFPLKDLVELTIGRDPASMIKYDPVKYDLVARNQAKIRLDIGNTPQFSIIDLNSRNGTFVNWQRISGATIIKPGDIIRFGPNGPEFEFDIEPRSAPPQNNAKESVEVPLTRQFSNISASGSRIEQVVIKHISGSRAGQMSLFPLNNLQEISIGRDNSAMIKYDPDKDDLVGRFHAKIVRNSQSPGLFDIVDLNSRNGTFVNKKRVMGQVSIKPGDLIQLGPKGPEFEFTIELRSK